MVSAYATLLLGAFGFMHVPCVEAQVKHPKMWAPGMPPVSSGSGQQTAASVGFKPANDLLIQSIPQTFVVKLNPSATGSDLARLNVKIAQLRATYKLTSASGIKKSFPRLGFLKLQMSSDVAVAKLLDDPAIKMAAMDYKVKASQLSWSNKWGLVRITNRAYQNATKVNFPNTARGNGVDVYVVDTGVDKSHPDIASRLVDGFYSSDSVVGEPTPSWNDGNGHGTHVAGTIGSSTRGVADSARIVPVRVLAADGSGSYSGVLEGLEYVRTRSANLQSTNPTRRFIVNMSLGGPRYTPLDDAVKQLTDAGIAVVVAAGNELDDACAYSPSGATTAIAVGAVDMKDQWGAVDLPFSNYGSCVDILAPGVNIESLKMGGGYVSESGTSMASPHVAGALAVFWSLNLSKSRAEVEALMLSYATRATITSFPTGVNFDTTTRLLLYVGADIANSISPCNSSPCQNGGTCSNTQTGGFQCTCTGGFTGTMCEVAPNACGSSPCQNGGQCTPSQDGTTFTCNCVNGYTGDTCQTLPPNPCNNNPCQNNGQCFVNPTDTTKFTCVCSGGYSGDRCETSPDPCLSSPCQNGGICVSQASPANIKRIITGVGLQKLSSKSVSFVCECRNGYTGNLCETAPDPCVYPANPCMNDGVCFNFGGSFKCQCKPGFTGNNCQNVPDPCTYPSNPCKNGGMCSRTGDTTYTCDCKNGYTGTICETPPDRCDPNPCQNGGNCTTNMRGNPICICPPFFRGNRCQTPPPDPCAKAPCRNGGTCMPTADYSGFFCQCPGGFTGPTCDDEEGIDWQPPTCTGNCEKYNGTFNSRKNLIQVGDTFNVASTSMLQVWWTGPTNAKLAVVGPLRWNGAGQALRTSTISSTYFSIQELSVCLSPGVYKLQMSYEAKFAGQGYRVYMIPSESMPPCGRK